MKRRISMSSQENRLQQQQNLSTTFHGYTSPLYQDPSSGVTISYHSQSKLNKSKQFHTVTFSSSSISSSPTSSILASSSSSTITKSLASTSAFGCPTPIITHLIDIYPKAASTIPEPSGGKYPIELAIESGKCYHSVIDPLIDAFPQILFPNSVTPDPNSVTPETDCVDKTWCAGIDRLCNSLSSALMIIFDS